MKSVTKTASTTTLAVVGLLAAVACERPLEPVSRFKPTAPNLAVALQPGESLREVPLAQDPADGAYILSNPCDVFIGQPVVDPADGAPQRYQHQYVAVVPEGARVKLVGDATTAPGNVFTCDAIDRDENGDPILDANGNVQPVIDPVTLHAAKGDAPQINTTGVTLDLNGYSITVYPAFGTPGFEAFENIGISLAGSGITLTNSATVDPATGAGISRVYGFGHNIDVEADNPTVRGVRYAANGLTPDVAGPIFNLEAAGGVGIRLSTGTMTIDQVKSVNTGDEGQGFEARRLSSGFLTVSNSHFVGGGEGAFLREVSGVTFRNNYVGGGIATRDARSQSGRAIVIKDNVVESSTNGIVWGRDSRSPGNNLVIAGNKITVPGTCEIAVSRRAVSWGPYTLTTLGTANSRVLADGTLAAARTCRVDD